jgi:hypothetical protein
VTGIPYIDPDDRHTQTLTFHNSIIALGEGNGIYHKQRWYPLVNTFRLKGCYAELFLSSICLCRALLRAVPINNRLQRTEAVAGPDDLL